MLADANGDFAVTQDEFTWLVIRSETPSVHRALPKKLEDFAATTLTTVYFEVLDVDKNSKLSKAEIEVLWLSESRDYGVHDSDKNGLLDRAEFKKFLLVDITDPGLPPEPELPPTPPMPSDD